MKKRILSFLCAVAILMGMVTVPAFAAVEPAAINGAQEYDTLQAAVDAYRSGIITLEQDASAITVAKDVYLDLNGHTVAGVTVTGGTLFVRDAKTDDYTVADGVYGKVTGVSGAVQAADGYLQIAQEGELSFHRVDLKLNGMALRPGNAGVYYTSLFAGDEMVAQQVETFGVALSVSAEPTGKNMDTLCAYSAFTGFVGGKTGNQTANGTLLTGIMKPTNSDGKNTWYAGMNVYGRAYVKTADGYIFGDCVARNLIQQVEAIDTAWASLSAVQKGSLLAMYETYESVMTLWNVPNLKNAFENPGSEEPDGDTVIVLPIPVKISDGKVAEDATITKDGYSVTVPAGVQLATDETELTLVITVKDSSDSGVTLEENQVLLPLDVHVEGVSETNTVPLTIHLGKQLPENLNLGNYGAYHVENGNANEMALIPMDALFTAHNQYKYTLDGEIILHIATFSEIALTADTEAKWEGEVDHSWYTKNPKATEFEIRNADQLWSFSQIVGGMAKDDEGNAIAQDSFKGKTVKLLSDIDLNDAEKNNQSWIFYPIGYWNNQYTYENFRGVADVSSGFYSFNGTFDGNGNTISDFYQNTWEMVGDYNDGYAANSNYYRDGMGLFGKVYGGTVKNLTVSNFSCDSEHGTSGVIAAYADCGAIFENIAITNCNPRVYNIGNGGIVGCSGWYAKEASENKVTFRNITVDQTNKISALWDATGTSAGGILGQYYPTSGQSSADYPRNPGIHFENCHTAAIIEVNNDCCSNYHYYWYRYSGMLMGSVRANTKDSGGYTIADTTGITAEGCTYTYGNWNEYWYCELVKNTIASYTHDHQFGRLTSITDLSEISNDNGKTWLKEGNFALLNENRDCVDCYHIFKNSEGNLYRHYHNVADETNPNIYEDFDLNGDGLLNDLKEDRQRYFIPFGQLLTGDGMGVKAHYEFPGVTEVKAGTVKSEEKFNVIFEDATITTETEMSVADLFAVKDNAKVSEPNIHIFVSPVGEDSTVEATYVCVTNGYMENAFVSFRGQGAAKITITDYYFCIPTILYVTVGEAQPVVKFAPVENITVTSGNTKTLGELFTAVEGVTIDSVKVTVTGDGFTCTPNTTDWTQGVVTFNSGIKIPTEVNLTITDNDLCVESTVTITVEPVPVQKFAAIKTEVNAEQTYTLSELFSYVDNGIVVQDTTVSVSGGDTVVYTKADEWENATVVFNNVGTVTLTITDDYFCAATEVKIAVKPIDKFDLVFENTNEYLYRVGNADKSTVALNLLFKALDGVTVSSANIAYETVVGNASAAYTAKTPWTSGTIQFSGTGVIKVTISAANANPLTLNLEVVDAVNATSGISTVRTENNGTVKSNVVLLCDISSGFTVSEDYTFFGNGFTLKYTGDGRYLNNGLKQGIVTVSDNGTLDNLRIEASIYPRAYMYYGKTSLGDYVQDGPNEVDGDKTRYYYQLSAVVAKGDATVSNCYIYGGRTNIFVDTGNVTIQDTVLECGVVANVQIQSTSDYTLTLDSVTTIQYQVNATIGDTAKVMLGAGVIVGPDTTTNPTIVLDGQFKQYNWVTADDKEAISDAVAKKLIQGALDATDFNHTVNGKTASNLGIIYMNTEETPVENNTGLPYALAEISMDGAKGRAYSLQGATDAQIYSDYANADRSTVNGDYIPTLYFDLGDQADSKESDADTRYLYGDKSGVYALYQDGEDPISLDLTKLASVYKYRGILCDVTVSCVNAAGNALATSNGVVTLTDNGDYTLVFTAQDTVFYDYKAETVSKTVTRTYTVPLNLVVKEASIQNADVTITKTALDGVYTTVNLTDYKLRINFLDAISVTDYDKSGKGTTVDLSSNISSATLTPASVNVFTTASTITITYTDGRVLTVNLSKISGSSPGTKTATINTSGGVYFITDGALDNKPTGTSSQNKCTITSVSFKGNNGSAISNDTDVTVTWALGSSGGTCIAEGSLITMADGSKRAVENLRKGDLVMAFDHITGEIVNKEVVIVGKTYADSFYRNVFVFDDGTELNAINEHGIYDMDLRQYVNIGHDNYQDYLGHRFVSIDSQGNIGVKRLADVITTCESGYKYDIVTKETMTYVVEDTLSVTHEVVIIMNSFEFGNDLCYDAEAMQADVEKYGLYAYDDFAEYCDQETFEKYNMAMMKIGVGKGLYTKEHLIHLLVDIALNDDVQITD